MKLGGIGPEAAPSLHPGGLLWRRSSTRCMEPSVALTHGETLAAQRPGETVASGYSDSSS